MVCCGCKCLCSWQAVLVVAALIGWFMFVDQPARWVFDEKVLKQVAAKGIKAAQDRAQGNATSADVIRSVINEVRRQYPEWTQDSGRWLFNNAGGAMGSMTVLHSSWSEYLIIFGTAVGTEGHTGRFFAEDFFTIIYGEQWAYEAHAHAKEVYRPGDQHYLPRHTAKQYRMPEECWALEYARGNILSMMPFGLFDTLFSTLDFVTFLQTAYESGGGIVTNMMKGKL